MEWSVAVWSSASVHVLCMRSMRDHNPIYRRRHIHIHTQYTFLYVKPRERRIHFTRRTPYIYRSRTHYTIVSARKVSQNCTGLRFLLAPINRVNCHLIVFSLYLSSFSSYTNVRLVDIWKWNRVHVALLWFYVVSYWLRYQQYMVVQFLPISLSWSH